MDTRRKLIIPANAAKYDASCVPSGTTRRDLSDGQGLGSTHGVGICHGDAPDGRCPPRFAPAGQSTQMIVGVDMSGDRMILRTSAMRDGAYRLERVDCPAFSPIPHASQALLPRGAPLMCEHRRYQADWLMRFHGFAQDDICTDDGRVPPFVSLPDHRPAEGDSARLRRHVHRRVEPGAGAAAAPGVQADLFA
jgi:predicted DNA-binding helix-hairpin-helix protein